MTVVDNLATRKFADVEIAEDIQWLQDSLGKVVATLRFAYFISTIIYSFVYSLVYSFVYSLVYYLMYSLIYYLMYSLIYSLVYSLFSILSYLFFLLFSRLSICKYHLIFINEQPTSTFDEYSSEVKSGVMDWSPCHLSEVFWRQNAQKLSENDYELIRYFEFDRISHSIQSTPLHLST